MYEIVLKIGRRAVLSILGTLCLTSCSSEHGVKPAGNMKGISSESSISKSWDRIHSWLAEKAPKIVGNLNPPATQAEVDAAEKAFGCTMPGEWRDLYQVHNGLNYEGNTGSLFYGMEFMSLKEAILVHGNCDMQGAEDFIIEAADAGVRKGCIFNRKWIPFGTDAGGNTALCVDLDPAEDGSRGQIIFVDYTYETVIVLASSLPQFLEAFASDLERGAYFLAEAGLKDGNQFLECIEEIDVLNWHKSPRWRHLDRKPMR